MECMQGHDPKALVPRGCLLREVNADPFTGQSMEDPLLMAGFRGDRASVWAVQVRRTRRPVMSSWHLYL